MHYRIFESDSDDETIAEAEALVAQAGLNLAMPVQQPPLFQNDPSDDSDDDDATKQPKKKRKYKFHDRRILHLYDSLSPSRFKSQFRMSKPTFERLYGELEPFIKVGRSVNGKSLLPKEKLLVFLYCMGSNCFVVHGGTALDVSEGTIMMCVNHIIEACYKGTNEQKCFIEREIYMPSREEAMQNAEEFLKKSKNYPPGFPPIFFGSLDGCHIPVSLNYL